MTMNGPFKQRKESAKLPRSAPSQSFCAEIVRIECGKN